MSNGRKFGNVDRPLAAAALGGVAGGLVYGLITGLSSQSVADGLIGGLIFGGLGTAVMTWWLKRSFARLYSPSATTEQRRTAMQVVRTGQPFDDKALAPHVIRIADEVERSLAGKRQRVTAFIAIVFLVPSCGFMLWDALSSGSELSIALWSVASLTPLALLSAPRLNRRRLECARAARSYARTLLHTDQTF